MSDEIIYKEPVVLYKGNFRAEYCQKLINHMKTGKSFNSFAGTIGVTPKTIADWKDKHEEFQQAFEVGASLNMGFWEETAIDQSTGDTKGNSSSMTFMMKNLHNEHYKDKQTVEHDTNVVFHISTGIPDRIEDKSQLEQKEAPIEIEATVIDDEEDLL